MTRKKFELEAIKPKWKTDFLYYYDCLKFRIDGAYNKKPLVSLCTSLKDRLEHLQKTFLLNIEDNQNYPNCEFLLLNYNCPDPNTEEWVRKALESHIASGRVSYYYYPDSKTFERSHARNLAFRLAQGDIVCNVDADNFIGNGFVSYVSAALSCDGVFLSGPLDGRGLGGRICVRRKDWETVGGFDERIRSYGFEDLDFANRLYMVGLKKKFIRYENFCQTILHSDELRMKYHQGDFYEENWNLINKNIELGIVNPNGSLFGHGRVQKNFSDWLEV